MEKQNPTGETGPRRLEAARLFGVASEYHRNGRLADAVRGYGRVLALDPESADAFNNLGVALRGQGKSAAAIACYRRSLDLRPDNAGTHSNLGNVLRETGRLDESLAEHRKAVDLAPESPRAVYNLGLSYRDMRRAGEALSCFDRALAIRPDYVDCRWDRALVLLQLGRLKEGFTEYEWRWRLPDIVARKVDAPLWDGSDLCDRTLLLHQEQGFGDMIQFIRYARAIPRDSGKVVVACQPELVRLFETVPGVDAVVTDSGPYPRADVQAPLLSLPWIMGTGADSIPSETPYIQAPRAPAIELPARSNGRLNVGLAWAGKPSHKNDRNRSCPFEHFIGLFEVADVAFFGLQKGDRAQDIERHACGALITDLGADLQDFSDTAAVVSKLDLVISVDTSLVHLAGALNRPVWCLLPFTGDWRWGLDGETTPWYPSMTLFRQPLPGAWADVFTRLRAALSARVGEFRSG